MKRLKQLWQLVKRAASSFSEDHGPSMGAALAYYTIFSIAPLLFIVIMLAGLVFGEEAASGEIFAQLAGLIGEQGAGAVQTMVQSVREPAKGALGTIVGAGALLVGATTVFAELQSALDRIWRAPAREESGIWGLVRARLLSFGLILGIGFLLIVSLIASAALAALGKWWGPLLGGWELLAQLLNFVISFGLFTAGFALIYKFMPRVKIEWHDVWIGAVVTAALFTIGKSLIGLYIGKSAIASGFGAAGSIVVVVLWVYYSAQIFLFGAEFTWVFAQEYGSHQSTGRRGANEARGAASPAGAAALAGSVTAPVKSSAPARIFVPVPDASLVPASRVSAPVAFGLGCLLTALLAVANGLAPRRQRV
jgi:membrane protein